jgi:hydroxymethylbilane synthase
MLRIATRGTTLARWQAERVATLLGGDVELVIVTTTGDARPDTPITEMGGTGVFVKEVEQALLDGRADLAVHSAKDLPSSPPPDGLVLAAFPERADARDALVGSTLAGLRPNATIGSGSVRRRAQLAAVHPTLNFAELRGSIITRLEKASQFDAVVIAAAALERLDLIHEADEILDPSVMMPQVGQGALAVECRADDTATGARVSEINDPTVARAITAERAFLAGLAGGCDLPCGAFATITERKAGSVPERRAASVAERTTGEIVLQGVLASPDGRTVLRGVARGTDPDLVGRTLVAELLDNGGRELLEQAPG